jgi:hydrocephalus-inducing protein
MLVGTVVEPNVFFDVGKVNFGPLLISGKNKEIVHLKNLEDVPIAFAFDKSALTAVSEHAGSLAVAPMSGTVAAHGDCAIEITF